MFGDNYPSDGKSNCRHTSEPCLMTSRLEVMFIDRIMTKVSNYKCRVDPIDRVFAEIKCRVRQTEENWIIVARNEQFSVRPAASRQAILLRLGND